MTMKGVFPRCSSFILSEYDLGEGIHQDRAQKVNWGPGRTLRERDKSKRVNSMSLGPA